MVDLTVCCLGEQGLQVVANHQKLKPIVHLSVSWLWRMVTAKQCRSVLCGSVSFIIVGVYFLSVRNTPQFVQVRQSSLPGQSATTLLPQTVTLSRSHSNHSSQVSVSPGKRTTSNPFLSAEG